MDELKVLILIVLSILTIFCLYKFYEKKGLYYSIIFLNLITFITTFKIITVFKMNINMGIISLIIMLAIIYIFLNKYGYKETKELLKISLLTNIVLGVFIVITNYYIPSTIETISINIENTFGYNYKLIIIYPIIIFLSEYTTIKLYKFLTSIQNNYLVCIILTYIITALIYTIIFYMIGYIKILPIKESIFIGISTYIIGLAETLISLLFINYMTKRKVIK